MKVSVDVDKEKFIINVDDFSINVYEDLSNDIVPDAIKKSAWIAGVAYELEREYFKFSEIEKKLFLLHWKLWAVRWLKARGMKDTHDNVECAISKLFGSNSSISEKLEFVFNVLQVMPPSKTYTTWDEFFNDETISNNVKNTALNMYKIEMQHGTTYDMVIDYETRLLSTIKSLKVASEAYREKAYQENRVIKSI